MSSFHYHYYVTHFYTKRQDIPAEIAPNSRKVWVKVKKPLLDEYFPPCEVYVSNNLIADLKRAIKKQLGAPQTIAVHAPDLKYSIGIPIKAAFTLDDFAHIRYEQEGGWGQVHSFRNKYSPNDLCAMKFFGYSKNEPNHIKINEEVDLMWSLRNISQGVLKLHGTFLDIQTGYVTNTPKEMINSKLITINKHYKNVYPVIVMDLGGMDLFNYMLVQRKGNVVISEQFIALIFRKFLISLQNIHSECYIHRDLKLPNVLISNNNHNNKPNQATGDQIYYGSNFANSLRFDEDIPNRSDGKISIIDFGHMVELESGCDKYYDTDCCGTPGCWAPETLQYQEYSAKSDIWQAGCILYILLNGGICSPFHADYRHHIINAEYYPLDDRHGFGNISNCAKDLISKILTKNANQRLSIIQILEHPWLNGSASDVYLGDDYLRSIASVAFRRKVKSYFYDNNHFLKADNDNDDRHSSDSHVSPVSTRANTNTNANANATIFDASMTIEERTRYFFMFYDRDEDGVLSREEFHTMLNEILCGEVVTSDVIEHYYITVISQSTQGKIDMNTFRAFINGLYHTTSNMTMSMTMSL